MSAPPHFDYPFQFSGGHVRTVPQGSDAEVRGVCCRTILLYPLGSRPQVPEFGVEDESFGGQIGAGGLDLREIRSAIEANEPRASVTAQMSDQDLAEIARGVARVRLGVSVSGGE